MSSPSATGAPVGRTGDAAPAPTARSTNAITALVHLYRAEVGRLTAYRARMDTTTNWAITTSALLTTFAFGSPDVSHAALLFLMLTNYFFLQLEARRFRAYEASRRRAALLEREFYPELLGGPADPDWAARLLADLRAGPPAAPALGTLGWRLRRSYLAIHAVVVAAWVGKLRLAAGPAPTVDHLLARAEIGTVPGWLIASAVALFTLWLVALAVAAGRLYPEGDEEAVPPEA